MPEGDIDAIPPSAPVYNVKYVRIYDATPDVVTFGYTPGYTGVYPWHGTVVWGTGWDYRPWVGPMYWWPRPYTWGLSAHYNPWTGWGFGYSWSYPFFSVSFGWGGWFRPRRLVRPPYGGWGGGWHRPGGWGWYGPGGYRPPAVIAGHYWGSHGGGSWNRPLPNARPGAVRPAVRPIPGVRPGIGFRPPSKDIRPPAQSEHLQPPARRSRATSRVRRPRSRGLARPRARPTTSTRTGTARSTAARRKGSGSSARPDAGEPERRRRDGEAGQPGTGDAPVDRQRPGDDEAVAERVAARAASGPGSRFLGAPARRRPRARRSWSQPARQQGVPPAPQPQARPAPQRLRRRRPTSRPPASAGARGDQKKR